MQTTRHILRHLALCLILLTIAIPIDAQMRVGEHGAPLNTDSLHRQYDLAPWFGLYKDNYFVFGPPIGTKPRDTNTNVKFQISIAQRLTRSTLPGGTYLYLFYTQKCIWNVLEESLPMVDLNFNPGLGIAKPIVRADGRFIGMAQLVIEHESNGRDSIQSRSWNKISLAASLLVTRNITVDAKVWIPIVDGENNRDLLKYTGICQAGVSYMSNNRRFGAAIHMTKRKTWRPDFNTVIELSYRIFRNSNQYFFAQYYNGYGEYLLDYNKHSSHLRVGLVIKPRLFSEY